MLFFFSLFFFVVLTSQLLNLEIIYLPICFCQFLFLAILAYFSRLEPVLPGCLDQRTACPC